MACTSARRALTDSALCLVAACMAMAMFLPPWAQATAASQPRTLAAALAALLAMLLHWLLLGRGARRMGRPVMGWLALAVLLFPVGGAAALILLAWPPQQAHRAAHPASAAH